MIEKVIIIGFIVLAVWATMWEGAIFGFIRSWGEKNIPEKLQKPVFDCPVCMVPYYGSAAYWFIYGNTWQECMIVVIAAMGMNAALIKLFPE